MINKKIAIVIGSTGMVGTELIQLLLQSNEYSEIVSLVRRPSGIIHPKLSEHCIDFSNTESWNELVKGNVLFSTLGTTIGQAKTKEAQYKVDFTYQYNVAEIAAKNGVENYVLISSAGASFKSMTFYMKMKGELEVAVQKLPFEVISIIRPGQLDGNRSKKRFGEKTGLSIIYFLNKLGLLKTYRPIPARQVALAMMNVANKTKSASYTLEEVFKLAI
jgi:uncharacterized protein YbjT (DUF2867 family)